MLEKSIEKQKCKGLVYCYKRTKAKSFGINYETTKEVN